MKAALALAASLLVCGCVTPIRPDPGIDLTGDWRITAVSGVATPGKPGGFNFRYVPPAGSAQFGCNWGSGSATARNGWFVAGGWIVTAGGCSDERVRFERQGFVILGKPLAVQGAGPGRVLLRNERGSLTFERQPVRQLAGTRWQVLSVNGHAGGGRIVFSPSDYRASFGCNDISGEYRQEGDRFRPFMSRMTEKGCERVPPGPVPLMIYEKWGADVLLGTGTRISAAGEGRLRLENAKGVILLERAAY